MIVQVLDCFVIQVNSSSAYRPLGLQEVFEFLVYAADLQGIAPVSHAWALRFRMDMRIVQKLLPMLRRHVCNLQGFSVADFLESIQKKADADGGEAQKKSKPS